VSFRETVTRRRLEACHRPFGTKSTYWRHGGNAGLLATNTSTNATQTDAQLNVTREPGDDRATVQAMSGRSWDASDARRRRTTDQRRMVACMREQFSRPGPATPRWPLP
jgi:hypothetical protein